MKHTTKSKKSTKHRTFKAASAKTATAKPLAPGVSRTRPMSLSLGTVKRRYECLPAVTSKPSESKQKKTGGKENPALVALRARNQAARRLLATWMADESGYDEENWPKIKKAIEENRSSYRKRFSD